MVASSTRATEIAATRHPFRGERRAHEADDGFRVHSQMRLHVADLDGDAVGQLGYRAVVFEVRPIGVVVQVKVVHQSCGVVGSSVEEEWERAG